VVDEIPFKPSLQEEGKVERGENVLYNPEDVQKQHLRLWAMTKTHISTVCLERHTTILQKDPILCNKIFLKDNRMLGNGRTIGIL